MSDCDSTAKTVDNSGDIAVIMGDIGRRTKAAARAWRSRRQPRRMPLWLPWPAIETRREILKPMRTMSPRPKAAVQRRLRRSAAA
jgi:hypothetical protein